MTTALTEHRGVSAETLGRSLAVVRILLGLTFLLNGLVKLFGIHRVEIGPYWATSSTGPTPGSSSTWRSTATPATRFR